MKIQRKIRFLYQRLTRGWDDSETWNLNDNFMNYIIPRLKRYNELSCAYPLTLTEEQWNKKINEMIEGFELYVKMYSSDYDFCNKEQYKKDLKKVHRASKLFSKWWPDLWW